MTWSRLLLYVSFALLFLPLALQAQTPGDLFDQAELKFSADDLPEAERLYLVVLQSGDIVLRATCYDRLLAVYDRRGRQDLAVKIGASYERLLKEQGNRERLRQLRVQMGECWFTLGHWTTCETTLQDAFSSSWGSVPLSPKQLLSARVLLARVAEKRGDGDRADARWRQVEEMTSSLLKDPPQSLSPERRIELSRKLAEAFRFLGKLDKAAEKLQSLLPLHDELRDRKGKCETLKLLGDDRLALKEDAAAEAHYKQALEILEREPPAREDRSRMAILLLKGDLLSGLSVVHRRRQESLEADNLSEKAVAAYRRVLAVTEPGEAGPSATEARKNNYPTTAGVNAFWKLQQHYQLSSQYTKALALAESQAGPWGSILGPRLKAEQGSLQAILSVYQDALDRLRDAVAQLEKQDPPNLIDLPRALNNLAVVEQSTDNPLGAEEHGRQCLELYRRHELPADLVQVATYNLLGTSIALRGDYGKAINEYRQGVALCETLAKLGEQADVTHSDLLLNIALLYKAQHAPEDALAALNEAEKIFLRFAPADSPDRGAFFAARASILAHEGKVDEAYKEIGHIQEIYQKNAEKGRLLKRGLLWNSVLHVEGLYHLKHRQFDKAEEAWRQAEKLQVQEKQILLLPRTLNYLGLTAEVRGQLEEAERRYRQAYQLQQSSTRTYPIVHFITCWRLAGVVDRLDRRAEARKLLEEAVAGVESARLKTYGDYGQRADYFAQCDPGFEKLVTWCVEGGDLEGAVGAIARVRSRTLTDQLARVECDPRQKLRGRPEGEALLRQEEDLLKELAGLRAKAQLIGLDEAETPQARELLDKFERVQKEYTRVWREVINASHQINREPPIEDPAAQALAMLRGLKPKTVLLVYFLGREKSWLLLGRSGKLEVFPLMVPETIAQLADSPKQMALADALTVGRAMILERRPDLPALPLPPAPSRSGQSKVENIPLSKDVARVLVENYQRHLTDPRFQPTRGFVLHARHPNQEVPPQRLELLGDVFLPVEVRQRIRAAEADQVIVVPDGALHKLPLEALVVDAGDKPRYLLDELPPLLYSPSLVSLAILNQRKAPRPGPLKLLTVADPAYAQLEAGKKRDPDVSVQSAVGLRGQLPLLPGTLQESQTISSFFDKGSVTALIKDKASESQVVDAVPNQRVIHLAAHGYVAPAGNLLGALALSTPPLGKESARDDGFLSLTEIYSLPLQDCELAVLSACVTFVGPLPPLEAGVTVASIFLIAGAHRVVASHWHVDDRSTAELMERFFAEVTPALKKGGRVSYARALRQAQLQLRNKRETSSPYFWAPFVLLGPED